MSTLLTLSGEGVTIGDLQHDEAVSFVGRAHLSVQLADGRTVAIVGLTREECLQCTDAFLAPAVITIGGEA